MDFAGALPVFVITLREGVEAALVVGIVLAALTKSQKDELIPWVYWGIFAGVGGSLFIGQLLSWGLRRAGQVNPQLEPVLEPFLKSGLCVVAIAMLSWMLIWMTQQSKSLKGEIENALTSSLQTSAAGWGVFTLVGIAVLREGFETVLFIFANAQQSSAALGAIAGLTGAVGIGFALFKWGVRINLRRFFQVMGILLLLIVAGLVVSALKNIDAAIDALSSLQSASTLCFSNDSCVLGPLAWDTSAVLPDQQFPGVIFKALLGYRDHLYWLQVIGYGLFLITVGTLYFRSLGGPLTKPLSSRQSAS
jgi:high-affinity iron transporter